MNRHSISQIEVLERRCLMSASATAHFRNRYLIVRGTKGPDDLTVSQPGADIIVTDGSTQLISTPASSVYVISIKGGGGGDTITIESSVTGNTVGEGAAMYITDLGKGGNTINDQSNIDGPKIRVGNGANTIDVSSSYYLLIKTGNGADTVTVGAGGEVGGVGLVTGTGDQTVTLGSNYGANVYYRGDGTVTMGGGDIVSGNSPDTINLNGYDAIWAGPRSVISGSSNDTVYTGPDPVTNISGVPSSNIVPKDPRRYALRYDLSYNHGWDVGP